MEGTAARLGCPWFLVERPAYLSKRSQALLDMLWRRGPTDPSFKCANYDFEDRFLYWREQCNPGLEDSYDAFGMDRFGPGQYNPRNPLLLEQNVPFQCIDRIAYGKARYAHVTPDWFLKACPLDENDIHTSNRISELVERMKEGMPFDSPFIDVVEKDSMLFTTGGFEGRHRMAAARRVGIETVGTFLFLTTKLEKRVDTSSIEVGDDSRWD